MTTVLVVDDQALVRAGFAAILDLEDDLDVVGELEDGDQVLAAVRRLRPDVVLMDIKMPRVDGVEALRQLRRHACRTHVLMLTTFDLEEHLHDALRAGASGFILKDAPRSELLAAVRAVARGEVVLAPKLLSRVVERYAAAPGPAPRDDQRLGVLTQREREVFGLVGHGLANREIADRLLLSEATIRTHLTHIFDKLGLRDRVQAVVLAYETGAVSPSEDDTA